MTEPAPPDHAATAKALLAQSIDEDTARQIVKAQSTVARAQVHALLAIAAALAPAPVPEPTPEEPADAELPI